MYFPVQAGRASHAPLPYTGDDSGDNISKKNDTFCELTCLYWAWKNLDADAIGLCHYRRYFAGSRLGSKQHRILTLQKAEKILSEVPAILPEKRHYFIETSYSQFAHAHHETDLIALRSLLQEQYPSYVFSFDKVMKKTSGHRFNMFIMQRPLFDTYCTWLFDILLKLEATLDLTGYSTYDKRVYGFLGERLLDVWIDSNQIPYRECPVIHMESQHWIHKGFSFLRRKFFSTSKKKSGLSS